MSYDPEDDCECICHEDEDEEDAWAGPIPASRFEYAGTHWGALYVIEETADLRFEAARNVTPIDLQLNPKYPLAYSTGRE